MGDRLENMIHDLGQESFQQAHAPMYEGLQSDSKKPLYTGCKNSLTLLSVVLSLVNVKVRYGWSDKSFTLLLQVVHDLLPEENTLPKSYYQAKKILCSMGMEYQKIHACPKDCILYRHEFKEMPKCPRCGASRYKVKDDEDCNSDENSKKGPPVKVLGYLPIIPRFKRLFANGDDAKYLTWHENGRNSDGMVHHLADCSQWKKIDGLYLDFGKEATNLRLGLASDGMNPYGNLSTQYSS